MKAYVVFAVLLICVSFAPPVVAQEQVRVVTLAVLIDSTDDTITVLELLHDVFFVASQTFQKEFSIKLELTEFNIGLWFAPSNNFDGCAELEKLIQIPRKSDIIVAFTTKSFFIKEKEGVDEESEAVVKQLDGLAMILGNHAIVKMEKKTSIILVHELGHIFGALYSNDNYSVLNGINPVTLMFDKESKEQIFENLHRE